MQSIRLPRANNRGFTLVEVMIALMVFVAMTMIFAVCVPAARKASKLNGQYSQAISLCQHKIDECRAVGYGRLTYAELYPIYIDASPTSSPYSFVNVDGVGQCLIQPTATLKIDSTHTDYSIVTVTITWKNTSYGTKTSTATLSAYIYNVE